MAKPGAPFKIILSKFKKKCYPRYDFSILQRVVNWILLIAFSFICLTLSRVRHNSSPISSRVKGCFIPKQKSNFKILDSRVESVFRALSISKANDSFIRFLSGLGVSEL